MAFNLIDILLILIVLLSVWGGWRRGFILGLLDLARWILSFLAGLYFYQPVAGWLGQLTGWSSTWNQPVAFILIIVIVGLIVQSIGGALLKRIPKHVHEHRLNHFFGVLPGAANGLITAAIVSALLLSVPFSDTIYENARESPIANRLSVYTEQIETALSPIFDKAVEQTFNRITIKPESNERVELPFRVENFRARPDLEAQMLEMVNGERAANGLPPLAPDPEMTEVARRHSADMFVRGYFSHNTPENKTPFDRMRESDVRFRTAGENLALAPTLEIAHTGLMNSPGHRANILEPRFGRLGIGVLDGGRRGLMITQNFRN
ncbi:MAG: uncharacterized protein JWN60_1628 [Acidobacteria bacterium]|nr:uncharacterized protein [Acidobacteriota bacterium]